MEDLEDIKKELIQDKIRPLESEENKSKKFLVLLILILLLLGAAGAASYMWFFNWRFHITTDDAYIEGDIATIAPKVNGYILDSINQPNIPVKKGEVLFRIDDRDYKTALERARMQISAQSQSLNTIDAQISMAKANLQAVEAQKKSALALRENTKQHLSRLEDLLKDKYATPAQVDDARMKLKQADASVLAIEAQIAAGEANIETLRAKKQEIEGQIKTLNIALNKTKDDLGDTLLKAPFDGIISNIVAKKGDLVSPGQRLASLVPVNNLYVVANFKETQISSIEPGAIAEVTIDAIEKRTFKGRVASIAPATGALFSLLPPQNATGNFTKVVQRIPVRIDLPQDILNSGMIRAGMSVVVDIDIRNNIDGN